MINIPKKTWFGVPAALYGLISLIAALLVCRIITQRLRIIALPTVSL
jgi:hypothetical protein